MDEPMIPVPSRPLFVPHTYRRLHSSSQGRLFEKNGMSTGTAHKFLVHNICFVCLCPNTPPPSTSSPPSPPPLFLQKGC